ncbi:MAG: peptide chain release factor N(5)-glutamine methyltransferase [Nitrospirae bacterium]|nr:peptide chain release factor N(5)-glutamine methyltransferase [Nitrospirota bacterium]
MMRAADAFREVSTELRSCGVEDAGKEAEVICARFAGIERVAFYRDNPVVSGDQLEGIRQALARRKMREPLQYIVGYADFYGLKIKVGPGVLIPRPETELIVEEAIKFLAEGTVGSREEENAMRRTPRALRILDLCTGSGCVALALAKEIGNAVVYGTDSSEKALEYADLNARMNNAEDVTFLKGDLYEPVEGLQFDLVVSNPPYVRRKAIDSLQPEIAAWEPREALDGGEDGLAFYRRIFALASRHLAPEGSLIVELGDGEAEAAVRIAGEAGLVCASLIRDYGGIERVLRLVLR